MLVWADPPCPHLCVLPLSLRRWNLLRKSALKAGGRICHYVLDRAGAHCWSGIRRRQQGPKPNFGSKGDDKHVSRKARTWFKSCQFKVSPSNVGIEWIIPQERSPGRTAAVLILWKQPTLVHNSLRPCEKWKGQTKDRRPWDEGCSMVHAGRGLWLFPVQCTSLTRILTGLQRATSNNNIGNPLLKAVKILMSCC